jgi:rifampicin phosphotransferase
MHDDFPVAPEQVGNHFWLWDRLHCPRPLTPLEHELLTRSTGLGFTRAITELGSTLTAASLPVNYYHYLAGVPLEDLGGETAEDRQARYQKNVAEIMATVGERWEKEWLPSILPDLERDRGRDFTVLSDAELLAAFAEMHQGVLKRWYIHGFLLYAFAAANIFAEFYKQTLQPEDDHEGFEALQGFPNIALDSSLALWRLSRRVRSNPELRRAFETGHDDDLLERLGASEEGRTWLTELRAYLDAFGWRADSAYELTKPSWREDPRIPLDTIRGYLGIDDDAGPEAQYRRAVERREQLLAGARRRLASEPNTLERFDELYKSASSFAPVVENHNHWIDQMGDIVMRYPCLEIGRRLADRGSLAAADDVFLLHVSELTEALTRGRDFKATAAQRRAEMEHFASIVPPLYIGTPGPPNDDPIEQHVLIPFFGLPVAASGDPRVINGIAASPGTARGTARVVRSLSEASKLRQGDIMVCEMTLPPWTPLFSTIGAVVADTGGVLSHCAVIARESRLPCVVGTGNGSSVIKDGMTLTVDGSRGIVCIEEPVVV